MVYKYLPSVSLCVIWRSPGFSVRGRGADLQMTLLRRVAILSLFLIAAASHVWAQTGSTIIQNGKSMAYDGYTFTISNCAYGVNTTTLTGSCTGNSTIDLVGMNQSRGGFTLQVQNAAGTGSAALSETSTAKQSYLSFTVTVSGAGPQISGATLTGTGVVTNCASSCSSTVTTSIAAMGSTMNDPWVAASGSKSYNTSTSFAPMSLNTVAFNENLDLNSAGVVSGATLSLTSVALRMTRAPEPASIAILLCGVGGLTLARRRRRRG
jgi:hypothetical protein